MGRATARLRHDEVTRLIKGVQNMGLPIARVSFDGERVDVIIGESGEKIESRIDERERNGGLIREPQV